MTWANFGNCSTVGVDKMPTTNKKLLALIKRHGLTSQQIADLLHTSRSTVEKWRQADGNVSQNTMPKAMLELLEIKLERD